MGRPYKIALVCDWFLPRMGGIELNMRDLALHLKARGHDVHVVTALPGPEVIDGIRVHRLPVRMLPFVDLCYGKKTVSSLEELFRKEKYDVVHGHYLLSALAHMGFYVARRQGIPTVFTHHSVSRFYPKRLILSLAPYIGSLGASIFMRTPLRARSIRPDVITAVSHAVAEDTKRVYRTDDVPLLPNGIDPGWWHYPKSPAPHFQIVSVMRLNKPKYPRELIRAIPKINALLPEGMRPIFKIIGDGPQRTKMEEDVLRLGLVGQVEFLGFRPREEIRLHFAESHLFVLPSLREGFGIAVLEARTAGVPAVAMNHGGIGDILEDGRDGYLTNTYDEFVDRIVRLVKDERLLADMQREASRPLHRFSWDAIIDRHLDVYRLAMERRGHAPFDREDEHAGLPDRRYGT
jgi:glycogen synthase